MINWYDSRPISEIRDELLETQANQINLIAVCILLCDRVSMLESKIKATEKTVFDMTSQFGGTS